MSFQENWEKRKEVEPVTVGEENISRNHLYTYLVDVTDEEVKDNLVRAQAELDGFSCIRNVPADYFHITVKLAGYRVEKPTNPDEFDRREVLDIVEESKNVLKDYNSFNVSLENLNIFPKVVFAEVHDNQVLKDIHSDLNNIGSLMEPEFNYTPHVTLSHFKNKEDFSQMVEKLEDIREMVFGEINIEKIFLVHYNLDKPLDQGFDVVEEFQLD